MKKTIVKVLAVALVVMTVFTTCACAFASDTNDVASEDPTRYSVINSASLSFTISGVTASGAASLTAQTSTSLQIVMTLQKKSSSGTWSNVKTWSKSGSGRSLDLTASKTINVLNTYRMKATFTAGGETATIYRYH